MTPTVPKKDEAMHDPDDAALEMTERLLRERCTDAVLFRADAGEWCGDLWDALDSFGLPLAMVSEKSGGLGMTPAEALRIAALAGRAALPLPMPETMLSNWLLDLSGLAHAEGPAVIVPQGLSLVPEGGDWRLLGTAPKVPWGRSATVVAVTGGQVVRAGRTGALLRQAANIANEPRDTLRFDQPVPADAVAPLPAGVDPFTLLAALRCAQMAGAMEQITDLTTDYALQRHQFGKPLAKFQAVQQSLAVLIEHAAAGQVAAGMACEAVASLPMRSLAVAAGKVRIGEAAGNVAGIAHQVHGAIGFSHEYRLHHLTRRLWSWREEYGNETHWARKLGAALAAAGPDGLWPAITAI